MDKQVFRKKVDSLPEELRNAYFSVDVNDAVVRIGNQHQLHVDQIGVLAGEVGNVIAGITHPSEFVNNLSKRLGVPMEQASGIAKEIDAQVFQGIREELKKLYAPKEEDLRFEPHPAREEILRGIEEPESYKVESYKVVKSENTPEVPPETLPETLETKQEEDLLQKKLTETFRKPPTITKVTLPDPYKEGI